MKRSSISKGFTKGFRDGLDRKLIFSYTMKMSTKQSSKTGIFSKRLLNGFPQKFEFIRYIHFILGDIGPENLFGDDLDGILEVF